MNRSLVIPIGIIAFLIAVLFTGLVLDPQPLFPVVSENSIPNFSLINLIEPEKKITNQDLIGKVWLVNVWASWCKSCRTEHPLLMKIAQKDNTAVFGLNYQDQPSDALQWIEQMGNPYQMIGADITGEVGEKFGITGTPETFILDDKGVIRFKQTGQLNPEILDNKILPLLERLQGTK